MVANKHKKTLFGAASTFVAKPQHVSVFYCGVLHPDSLAVAGHNLAASFDSKFKHPENGFPVDQKFTSGDGFCWFHDIYISCRSDLVQICKKHFSFSNFYWPNKTWRRSSKSREPWSRSLRAWWVRCPEVQPSLSVAPRKIARSSRHGLWFTLGHLGNPRKKKKNMDITW